jgi:hypothetical protein
VQKKPGPPSSDQHEACVHHWIINAENLGVCKKCGSAKQFSGWCDAALIRKAWSRNKDNAEDAVSRPER